MFDTNVPVNVAALPESLRAEVLRLAVAGCSPDALVAPLIAHGLASEDAIRAAEVIIEAHLRSHAEANALPLPRRVPEVASLNAESVLDAGDRQVQLLASVLHPRVVVLGGLLTSNECDALIAAARSRLRPSTVVDPASGRNQLHDARTSEGMCFERGENQVCRRLEARIARLLSWPEDHGEGVQILRYGVGAEYRPHYDYFDPEQPGNAEPLSRGGQRVATIVIYLNTPRSGGATVFPGIGLEVAPIRGNAVFFSYDRPHPMTGTLHGGAPVNSGEKWIATKWLRESPHL